MKKYYHGERVGANDIGAINYLAEIDCLDLWGLANKEVAQMKLQGNYDNRKIYELGKARRVKIAILYDEWFARYGIGGVPAEWVKVGEWKIQNNIVCGSDFVSFYAVQPEEKEKLAENLKEFAGKLLHDVEQSGG